MIAHICRLSLRHKASIQANSYRLPYARRSYGSLTYLRQKLRRCLQLPLPRKKGSSSYVRTSADMQHPALFGNPSGCPTVPSGQKTLKRAQSPTAEKGRIRLSTSGCVPARMTVRMEARHLCLSPRLRPLLSSSCRRHQLILLMLRNSRYNERREKIYV